MLCIKNKYTNVLRLNLDQKIYTIFDSENSSFSVVSFNENIPKKKVKREKKISTKVIKIN